VGKIARRFWGIPTSSHFAVFCGDGESKILHLRMCKRKFRALGWIFCFWGKLLFVISYGRSGKVVISIKSAGSWGAKSEDLKNFLLLSL